MAVMMAGLQDLAWLRMNAALRHEVPTFKWATVHTSSPGLTIILEGDESQQPRQVSANAVGPLTAGQRVRVEMQGTRITVTAAQMSGFLMPDGVVDIISPLGAGLRLGTSAVLFGSAGPDVSRLAFFASGQATLYGPGGQFLNFQTGGGIQLWSNNNDGELNIRGGNSTGIRITANGGATYIGGSTNSSARIYLDTGDTAADAVYVRNGSTPLIVLGSLGGKARMNFYDPMTITATANLHMNASGWIYLITSREDAKLDIEPLDVDDETYLAIEPKTWFDRAASEALADYFTAQHDGTADDLPADYLDSISKLERVPGLVAEQVAESGNEWLVQRDDDGELIGVSYDRGWVPLLTITKRLRSRVTELENTVSRLESQLAQVLQLLQPEEPEDD